MQGNLASLFRAGGRNPIPTRLVGAANYIYVVVVTLVSSCSARSKQPISDHTGFLCAIIHKNMPVQEYWLPGYGLSRQIVLSQLPFFLGPTASVRPFTYHVCRRMPFPGTVLTIDRAEKATSSMAIGC